MSHSSGDDKITMDILKAGAIFIAPCLAEIYSKVMETGKFPLPWKRGLIIPLFKKGDPTIAANFRGITLSSNVSKIFSRVLNTRLVCHLNDHNILVDEQAGFRSNLRSTNHAFSLHSIIQKYIKNNNRMYSCFVDLKAAFDSVWRNGLWFKLLAQYGIGGKFLNILMDMNQDINNRVRLENGMTDFFTNSIGVKQGDNLSPTLFALFLNDLPSLFSAEDNPASLGELKFHCMLYADDLVLLSETPEGLQSAVSKLQNYCHQWRLTINVKKTKTLVFNKGGRLINPNIQLNGTTVDSARDYEYLGVLFSVSGSMNPAMEQQYQKALRAWFSLTNAIPNSMIHNVSYVERLFDALVAPVALYWAEIWAFNMPGPTKATCPLERLNLRMCKYILGVTKRASTVAVMGEMGRYPLKLLAEERAVAFWLYTKSYPKTLVGQLFQQLYRLPIRKTDWLGHLRDKLNQLGFGYVAQINGTKNQTVPEEPGQNARKKSPRPVHSILAWQNDCYKSAKTAHILQIQNYFRPRTLPQCCERCQSQASSNEIAY